MMGANIVSMRNGPVPRGHAHPTIEAHKHMEPRMQRRLILLAALGVASFLPTFANAAGESPVSFKHSIDIETPPGKVLVELTFTNQGTKTVWIPRELAAEKELTGRRFDVRDAGGKPVAYTGKMV